MHLRTLGLFAALVSTGVAVAACSPDSKDVPTPGPGASTGSPGAGGAGGAPFGGGACDDPKDGDVDFVADELEPGDTDQDGAPDEGDADSDDDGILDAAEASNPALEAAAGGVRDDECDALADTDGDGTPDLRDRDADADGVTDEDETAYDPDGSKNCWRVADCDLDGIIDLIEVAANTDPADAGSVPADPGLYFVLPYAQAEQTKDFDFSTGVVKADIYFLIDTTVSMQAAIDDLKASINDQIIPKILNGDMAATPPIPAISDAWIGVGSFRDVPWGPPAKPYGEVVDTGSGPVPDAVYRHRFVLAGAKVAGDTAPPLLQGGEYEAPQNVQDILASLVAGGGGDAPEATTQALWMAATNATYAATGDGLWKPELAWGTPYPVPCSIPGSLGVPCFRPDSLPLFVVVSDAPFHNGPLAQNDYDPTYVQGVKTYAETVDALDAIGAKVIGVPVATGSAGLARSDMTALAEETGSFYDQPPWGKYPLVAQQDVASGQVSDEVVHLIGKLAGAGLKDVTTKDTSYDCTGGLDCTGDGVADLEFHNPAWPAGSGPFDAAQLITKIATVESAQEPKPYVSLDPTTFFGVRGVAPVTFRVHAKNDTIQPTSMLVLRALIRVQTPAGQILGGTAGVKLVYFVIPAWVDDGPY